MNSGSHTPADRIERHVWLVAAVVVLGTVASILATTIVNVAIERLSVELHSPLEEIQWVSTGYLLGLAAVIPITGWLARRTGAKRAYLASLSAFVLASVLCALAWSAPSLIAFRVLQGVAGGVTLPLGQMMLATAAGPRRMGRVMSVVGVPMVLGPVLGPAMGGLLLDHLSWHWIFVMNVPLGLLGLALGIRLLPDTRPEEAGPLDLRGLVLLAGGLPLLLYGLAEAGGHGGFASAGVLGPVAAGVLLLAAFVAHAARAESPLLDVRLFTRGGFSAAATATFFTGAALYGAMILLPLYFQVVRGESALTAGLLLAPQGIGAGLAMPLAGRLADRVGGGRVAVVGIVLTVLGTLPLAAVTAATSYWDISAALVVRGLGIGAAIMPLMAAAYATLDRSDIPHATPQLNVLQRVGGSVGTALLTVVLSQRLADAQAGPAQLAGAFGHAYVWATLIAALAVLPALALARIERPAPAVRAPAPELDAAAA